VPVVKLFVEGRLDLEVLNPIFTGSPTLVQGGSKYTLKSRAFTEREENKVKAGYIRDRDFDFEPPKDLTSPTVDSDYGWRWCRHEMENYLLEPTIINQATGWVIADIEDALRQAATSIRSYQAARWTIGQVRRSLPPDYQLKTRPDNLKDIEVPQNLDKLFINDWTKHRINEHRTAINTATDPNTVESSLQRYADYFNETFIADTTQLLVWFSGKDLMAGMGHWLVGRGVANPGVFRAQLRDWIITNPAEALNLLPEWKGMLNLLK